MKDLLRKAFEAGELCYQCDGNEGTDFETWYNETYIKQLHKPVVGGTASASALEGEQLGNEGSAKSVCGGVCYNCKEHLQPQFKFCSMSCKEAYYKKQTG